MNPDKLAFDFLNIVVGLSGDDDLRNGMFCGEGSADSKSNA